MCLRGTSPGTGPRRERVRVGRSGRRCGRGGRAVRQYLIGPLGSGDRGRAAGGARTAGRGSRRPRAPRRPLRGRGPPVASGPGRPCPAMAGRAVVRPAATPRPPHRKMPARVRQAHPLASPAARRVSPPDRSGSRLPALVRRPGWPARCRRETAAIRCPGWAEHRPLVRCSALAWVFSGHGPRPPRPGPFCGPQWTARIGGEGAECAHFRESSGGGPVGGRCVAPHSG